MRHREREGSAGTEAQGTGGLGQEQELRLREPDGGGRAPPHSFPVYPGRNLSLVYKVGWANGLAHDSLG